MKQAVPWWFFFPDVTSHYLMWLLRIAAVPWGWCDFSRLMWLKYGVSILKKKTREIWKKNRGRPHPCFSSLLSLLLGKWPQSQTPFACCSWLFLAREPLDAVFSKQMVLFFQTRWCFFFKPKEQNLQNMSFTTNTRQAYHSLVTFWILDCWAYCLI